jgi:hypothetical protein
MAQNHELDAAVDEGQGALDAEPYAQAALLVQGAAAAEAQRAAEAEAAEAAEAEAAEAAVRAAALRAMQAYFRGVTPANAYQLHDAYTPDHPDLKGQVSGSAALPDPKRRVKYDANGNPVYTHNGFSMPIDNPASGVGAIGAQTRPEALCANVCQTLTTGKALGGGAALGGGLALSSRPARDAGEGYYEDAAHGAGGGYYEGAARGCGSGLALSSRAAREAELASDGVRVAYLPYDGAAPGDGAGPSRMSSRLNFGAQRR